jgi:hypothetical protein
MGTFAETANVVYRLSFADQGKQTYVFRFSLQQTYESYIQYIRKMELYIYIYSILYINSMYTNIYIHVHIHIHILI